MTLLLDPVAVDGGGQAPAPTPTPTPAPAPTPAPPPVVPTVSLPVDEVAKFYALQRELDDIKKSAAENERVKEEQRLLALAQKGEVEKAMGELKSKYSAEIDTLRGSILNGVKADTISRALLGVKWASDEAATDALDILSTRIEAVYDANGNTVIRDKKTGLPAGETIKAWLADPRTAFYRAPSTTGGSGSGGGSNPPGNEKTPFEALAQTFNQQMTQGVGLFGK